MDERSSRRFFIPIILGALALVAGWHYACHLVIENQLRETVNESLRDSFEDVTASVEIGPLNNVVDIRVALDSQQLSNVWNLIRDALIYEISQQVRPEIERALHTRARRDMDVYAMMLPYTVSITVGEPNATGGVADQSQSTSSAANQVRAVQQALDECGYSVGQADGVLGPQTQRAIRAFRVQYRLEKQSIPLQKLPALVREKCSSPPTPPAEIQTLIVQLDHLNDRCRGGSGDDPATSAACSERDEIYRSIEAQGWCYGHEAQAEYEKTWQACR